ncbi:hypothetical protein MKX01_034285 [Papaver californicum]|nr:hypothetical protein MKX01_034285 [Papaver californicum]
MEKDFHQQHFHRQLPNLNSTGFLLDSNPGDYSRTCTNRYTSMVPPNASLPGHNVAGLPQPKIGQVNEPNGWFYCLPRHRQTLTHMPNSAPKEFSSSPYRHGGDGCGAGAVPSSLAGSDQKRFLVFDQSGDQTSLFYSSAVGSNVQNPCYGGANSLHITGLQKEDLTNNRELIPHGRVAPVLLEESQESGDRSEMHEDTEELNALLYSDDDEGDTDDEEISTGHSPRDEIGCQNLEEVGENLVYFASSACPTKRKRVLEEDHYNSSLVDTASSGEANHSVECKDDAESSCARGSMTRKDMESLPVNKRLRREKVRETVRILQNLIPGGKDKDAIVVIDEAIQYIKSLKLKARSMK